MERIPEKSDPIFESFRAQLAAIDPAFDAKECFEKIREVLKSRQSQFPIEYADFCEIKKDVDKITIRLQRPVIGKETKRKGHILVFNIGKYTKIDTSGLAEGIDISSVNINSLPRVTVPTISFVNFATNLEAQAVDDKIRKAKHRKRLEEERSNIGEKARGVID